MSYYWLNRKEILQKTKERYSKEKATEYYSKNKEATKKNLKVWYKYLSKEEKDKIKLIQYKKETLQNKWVLFLLSIRMSEKTLKCDNIRVNKKEFHKSKQPINLDLVNVNQILVSGRFKHSDDGFKYFVGYKEGEIVKPLCMMMNRYVCMKMMMCWINRKFGTRLKRH